MFPPLCLPSPKNPLCCSLYRDGTWNVRWNNSPPFGVGFDQTKTILMNWRLLKLLHGHFFSGHGKMSHRSITWLIVIDINFTYSNCGNNDVEHHWQWWWISKAGGIGLVTRYMADISDKSSSFEHTSYLLQTPQTMPKYSARHQFLATLVALHFTPVSE